MKMRRTGIDDKMVFYVRRYSEPEIGSYFDYSVDKVICNPKETFKYYLKIGGVTFLPKKPVPGAKISRSTERIKDSKYFGSYVYYGETDKKIRCILYAKRKGLPEMKLIGQPSCLHSIIPRYTGESHRDSMIIGMRIFESLNSQRRWSRYDTSTKAHHRGFYELRNTDDLYELATNMEFDFRGDNNKIGIYVGANTSLLLVDISKSFLHEDYSRDYVYTLFQEGAFICTNRPFSFCFYDEEETQEYDPKRLGAEMKHKLKDTPNAKRLWNKDNNILFLKSAPNYTFWTLRAKKYQRIRELEIMLCIPTGAQFECVYNWDEGIAEVLRRQSLKPWSKYTELRITPNPQFEGIDLYRNEAYPPRLSSL